MKQLISVAAGAVAIASAAPATAGHQIVYGPRTDAQANSATHQGPNVAGSLSHYVNGAFDPGSFVGPGGTIAGCGSVALTWAQSSQDGGSNGGAFLHNDAYAAADLAKGILKGTTAASARISSAGKARRPISNGASTIPIPTASSTASSARR
jgi:hypothetical protein